MPVSSCIFCTPPSLTTSVNPVRASSGLLRKLRNGNWLLGRMKNMIIEAGMANSGIQAHLESMALVVLRLNTSSVSSE